MEARKITIANSRDQKKHVITTAATTLGELKEALTSEGIDYEGMDFIEALTKTQLKDNSSVLPHDVPYNHTTTNELVFLLTVPNRKIKSGSRDEVYERINNDSDSFELKEAIKRHFGRNYTMVTTANLEDFLDNWNQSHDNNTQECHCNCGEKTLEERVEMLWQKVNNLNEAMMNVIDILGIDYIVDDVYTALTGGPVKDRTVYSAGMTADQIDELVKDIED